MQGEGSRFAVEFGDISDPVAAANATCRDAAVLLDKYEYDIEQHILRFYLVACKLGSHDVQLHIVHGATMLCSTTVVHADIIEGPAHGE